MKAYDRYISKQDIMRIHENTLRILENIGVDFENEKALDLFRSHGMRVDGSKVYIGQKALEEALRLVPPYFDLHVGADRPLRVGFGGNFVIKSPSAGNVYINDRGKIRKMDNNDIIRQFKLAETSPVVNQSGMNFLADYSGCNEEQKKFGVIAMQLKYSHHYPINLVADIYSAGDKKAYKIFKEAILLQKHFHGYDDGRYYSLRDASVLSPLAVDRDSVERIFATLELGQPMSFSACAMPLLTAPGSLAGMLSTTNAEILSCVVLSQLYRPGTPMMYGNVSTGTSMKECTIAFGAPETALVCYATAALADLYQIPFRTGGSYSDAKELDAQAGAETMMMLHASYECGSHYIGHSIGNLGSLNVGSFEKCIFDEELTRVVERQLRGVEATEEKLAYETIQTVGPRGTFLTGKTPRYFREEVYQPALLNKEDPNVWQNRGSKPLWEAALEIAEARIASYTPPQRTKEQLALLDPYLPPQYKNGI